MKKVTWKNFEAKVEVLDLHMQIEVLIKNKPIIFTKEAKSYSDMEQMYRNFDSIELQNLLQGYEQEI